MTALSHIDGRDRAMFVKREGSESGQLRMMFDSESYLSKETRFDQAKESVEPSRVVRAIDLNLTR